jgi:ATP-dependent Zn protease
MLIDGQHRRAREILSAHRSELDRVAEELVAKESITGARLTELIGPEQAVEASGATRRALPSASLAI